MATIKSDPQGMMTNPSGIRNRWASSRIQEVLRTPAGALGIVIVTAIVGVAIFAPILAPDHYAIQHLGERLEGPSGRHLLGTDDFGRDVLTRVIYGSRIALLVALPAVAGAALIGLVLGLVSGYLRGPLDHVILVLFDVAQTFPLIALALVMLMFLGASLTNLITVIAIALAPAYGRVVRGVVLSLREEPFIEAERALGAGGLRVALRHMIPNTIAPVIVLMALDIPAAIGIEAGLSFLGLGAQPPTPSWGSILDSGFRTIRETFWPLVSACGALALTTIGFTALGQALRDVFDPRVSTRRLPPRIDEEGGLGS